MVNNSININKTNNRLSPSHWTQKDHYMWRWNAGPGFGQAHTCSGVKSVNGTSTPPPEIGISSGSHCLYIFVFLSCFVWPCHCIIVFMILIWFLIYNFTYNDFGDKHQFPGIIQIVQGIGCCSCYIYLSVIKLRWKQQNSHQSIIFIFINHIQRYREDIHIHITNTE